jgi:hypothetical protein
MCGGCGLKQPKYGLASEGKKWWCASCGKSEGVGILKMQNLCEGCGFKCKNYMLASEGKRWWRAVCGMVEGVVRIKKLSQ